MSRINLSRRRPAEYSMLLGPQPAGPVVGTYAGKPIAAKVTDAFGRRYVYAGIAPRRRDGRYDLDALSADEWLVEPGLVYRGEKAAGSRLTQWRRRP